MSMTTARKLELPQRAATDAVRDSYLDQTAAEAQAVLEMMA
jgi:hypothetical protein